MQQVILLKDVERLGRRGRVVNVRDGYALNYLYPQGMGVRATAANLKRLEGLRKKFEIEEKERAEHARGLSARLEDKSLTLTVKASDEGHLYGSVNSGTIHEALLAEGFEIEPRAVRLVEPIKEVGVYTVPIHLHESVRVEIKVWVVAEKETAEAASGGAEPAQAAAEAAPDSAAGAPE